MHRFLKATLIVLVAANVVAAAAWFYHDELVKANLLPSKALPAQVEVVAAANLPEAGFDPAVEQVPAAAPTALEPAVEAAEATSVDARGTAAEDGAAPLPGQTPLGTENAPSPTPPDQILPAQVPAVRMAEPAELPARDDARQAGEPLACVLIGPFSRRGDALEAQRRFSKEGVDVRIVADSVPDEPHHLVYVAPLSTAAEAARIKTALTAQEVNAFVIPAGPRKQGVSVGLFKRKELANAQRDKVVALGHDVKIFVMTRNTVVYRLRAQGVAPEVLGGASFTPCPPDADTAVADGSDGN